MDVKGREDALRAEKAKEAKAAKEAKTALGQKSEPSPKEAANAKQAIPISKQPHTSEDDAETAAHKLEVAAKKVAADNAKDMESKGATWAGHGTPPPLSRGDVEVMAAPRPGFDPSLNPGGGAVESNHTTKVAASEAKLSKNE
jgi:hypothetical protein